MKIFAGSSNKPLALKICEHLHIPLGNIYLHTFPSGEKHVEFKEEIRGEELFFIQSLSSPANDNLMELLLMIDAAKRESASKITIVCPWMAYSRSERKNKPRIPISSKLVMDMINVAGADHVISVDLHSPTIQGFINKPFDNLFASHLLINIIENKDIVIVAPDARAVKRNETMARIYKKGFAFIAKRRLNDSDVEVEGFVGDVSNKVAVICDDLSESCGTILAAARICKEYGAKEVYAAITHPMFTELGFQRIDNDKYLTRIITTNSIPLLKHSDKIQIVDISLLLANAINRVQENTSISDTAEMNGF